MKMTLVNENYIRITKAKIKNTKDVVSTNAADEGSIVLTYHVEDDNGMPKIKDKYIGVHKHNVWDYKTCGVKYLVCDKKAVIFIRELEDDEKLDDGK